MAMLPPKTANKYIKGQSDHIDAWLISYSDLITLLFMVFVMIVTISLSKGIVKVEQVAPPTVHSSKINTEHSGALALVTPYENAYRNLIGIVSKTGSDQQIAIERKTNGIWLDLSSATFFAEGSAIIDKAQKPLLQSIARVLKENVEPGTMIEVEGHTADAPPAGSQYQNNWELAGARAAHVVNALIELGVNPAQLRAVSRGGSAPLVPNQDIAGHPIDSNRTRNQRIVIRVEQAQPATTLSSNF